MARGFESKDVEFQQSEAERRPKVTGPALTAEERDVAERRRTLELALARARGDREVARSDAHRRMLDQAVESLEEQLRRIS